MDPANKKQEMTPEKARENYQQEYHQRIEKLDSLVEQALSQSSNYQSAESVRAQILQAKENIYDIFLNRKWDYNAKLRQARKNCIEALLEAATTNAANYAQPDLVASCFKQAESFTTTYGIFEWGKYEMMSKIRAAKEKLVETAIDNVEAALSDPAKAQEAKAGIMALTQYQKMFGTFDPFRYSIGLALSDFRARYMKPVIEKAMDEYVQNPGKNPVNDSFMPIKSYGITDWLNMGGMVGDAAHEASIKYGDTYSQYWKARLDEQIAPIKNAWTAFKEGFASLFRPLRQEPVTVPAAVAPQPAAPATTA
jgi:hypothetical protein